MLSILRSNQWILLFRLLLLTLVLIQVSALPLCIRQNATTVQTVHITQTYVVVVELPFVYIRACLNFIDLRAQ